jgi:hypothetical protein
LKGDRMYPVLKFLNVIFWEFIQNLGVVPAVAAVWWWARQSRGKAALAILVSAAGTPLTIFLTEPAKIGAPGRAEIIATNIVVFGLLQCLIVPYLGSEAWWSNAKTDVVVGALAGITISVAQATAAHDRIAVFVVARHCLALGIACAAVFFGMRYLKRRSWLAAMAGALSVVLAMTLIIAFVDYGYVLVR